MTVLLHSVLTVSCYNQHFLVSIYPLYNPQISMANQDLGNIPEPKQTCLSSGNGLTHALVWHVASQSTLTVIQPMYAWLCSLCIIEIFPNKIIVENEEFLSCVIDRTDLNSVLHRALNKNLKLYVSIDESDNRLLLNNLDLDPDHNYFGNVTWDSSYNTPNALKTKFNLSDFTKLPFSTMHINCRSLLYKLDDVQSLLAELTVSVLAEADQAVGQRGQLTLLARFSE